jgi:16S rRNA (cytosine1402-N4)-methyltransferase
MIHKGNLQGEVHKDFYGNPQLPLRPVNRKPLLPSEEEVRENSRARSAKLRIAEKI